jgi:hypothetical protein
MTERRKQALIILAIAISLLSYGAYTFDLNGIANRFVGVTVAVAITFGTIGVGSGLLMLFTKTSLGLLDSKEPKPIIKKEKEMSKIKDAITKEKPTAEKAKKGSSVDLMKREKDLLNRRTELLAFLSETETELSQVRENLETKGWVNSDNGWVID